jgi:hypothetical protein
VTPPRFPARKLLAFAGLGALDFGLTWHLVRAGGGAVREANLVAAWLLGNYGWAGLAAFKAATMGLAAGLGVLIYLRRPAAGHRVLAFGCAALAAVVLYSGYLCHDLRKPPAPGTAEAALASENDRLDAGLERSRQYYATLVEVARDVRAGRRSLEDGTRRLAATEQARDPNWLRKIRHYYPDHTDAECLTISLLNHIELNDGESVCDDLRAEFQSLYGRPAPSRISFGQVALAPAAGAGREPNPPAPSVAQPIDQPPRVLAERPLHHPHGRKVARRVTDPGRRQHPARRHLG